MRLSLEDIRRHHLVVTLAFFVLLFIVGLAAFRDYGVSWDENNMFNVGAAAYHYVFNGEPWPTNPALRYYGTVFELPVAVATEYSGFTEARPIVFLRHFLTFCAFWWGALFFFLLRKKIFSSTWMGLLGAVFLVLSPRIFADAFYNSKDIPNLAFFTVAVYSMLCFLEKRTYKRGIVHAIASAMAIGVRLTSLLIPAMTILFFCLAAFSPSSKNGGWRFSWKSAAVLGTYMVACAAFTIAIWPFLWEHPLAHLLEAFHYMSSIGVDTYYMGEQIHKLPWHYVFVWIGISTPPLYVVLFCIGFVSILPNALRHPWRWLLREREKAILLGWFFLPILAVYVTGAGIFDGWRHLYFLYPAFLLVGLFGLRALVSLCLRVFPLQSIAYKRVFYGILASVITLSCLWTAGWMIANHPVENVYFSLPPSLVQHNFELDYWGLSFLPALQKVLRDDPSPVIPLWMSSSPGYSTLSVLPTADRVRIMTVLPEDAEYLLNNYRLSHYDQNFPHPEISDIMVGGVKVLGIYRNEKFHGMAPPPAHAAPYPGR